MRSNNIRLIFLPECPGNELELSVRRTTFFKPVSSIKEILHAYETFNFLAIEVSDAKRGKLSNDWK